MKFDYFAYWLTALTVPITLAMCWFIPSRLLNSQTDAGLIGAFLCGVIGLMFPFIMWNQVIKPYVVQLKKEETEDDETP